MKEKYYKNNSSKILVTGAAGFIGFHVCLNLINKGFQVVGLDNINEYYDPNLKYDRLEELGIDKKNGKRFEIITKSNKFSNFSFIRLDLADREKLPQIFENFQFDKVVNLAAQAGVRYSIDNPSAYIDANIVGFSNLLECCRKYKIEHLIYASSSSVYGQNDKIPFSTSDNVDHPISLYAATKKSNELMAFTYSHLYNLRTTGLRFFTVYGPWGRPDMAMFLFTDAIMKKEPIKVFNEGNLERDFTYIDDIVNGVYQVISNKKVDKYSIFNLGNGKPVKLLDFIEEIENQLGIKADKKMLPMQPGDVTRTWADMKDFKSIYNYQPQVLVKEGLSSFISWFKDYYRYN